MNRDGDDDHDTRILKFADRYALADKNKVALPERRHQPRVLCLIKCSSVRLLVRT
jgi:hypothetical protein